MNVVPASNRVTETTQESSGSTLRAAMLCSAVTICAPATIGSRPAWGWAAWPPRPSILMVKRSAEASSVPLRIANAPTGRCRHVVHAEHLLDAEALHQAVVEHRLAAAAAFFGGLEDHYGGPGKVAALREIARGAEQHRGMAVMPAGVHLAGIGRLIRQIGGLVNRQRVHVGAQADGSLARRAAAADDPDHAGLADAGRHFIAAERPQPVGDERGGARHVIQKFGMLMNVAAPVPRIGDKTLDGGVDRHRRKLQRDLPEGGGDPIKESIGFSAFERFNFVVRFSAFAATETPPARRAGSTPTTAGSIAAAGRGCRARRWFRSARRSPV